MKCNEISFGARLTTAPYYGKKLKQYLENGIIEFEKQTKNKPGCMTVRQLDNWNDSPKAAFFFWNSKVAPKYNAENYDQIAWTTRDFLQHLIVEKKPKEQADIFESIFDALQVIPKKIKKSDRLNTQFMSNLNKQISEKLGKYNELLKPMFEHLDDKPEIKKNLDINDIIF